MRAFPMILIAVLLYNLAAFGVVAVSHRPMQVILDQSFTVQMFSGEMWRISVGDLFALFALLLLFFETIKATRQGGRAVLNHALSMLVFCAASVEFIVVKGFSTSVFFLITAMCLFDVVAGYALCIVAARRDQAPPPDAEE